MDTVQLPEGYQMVMPYLILDNAIAFFEFTEKVFGAREKTKHLLDDGSLMHGEITIGGSTVMFGNASPQWKVQTAGLYIHVLDADVVFARAMESGATEVTPVSDQSYGRSGGIMDPFGNVWWITAARS